MYNSTGFRVSSSGVKFIVTTAIFAIIVLTMNHFGLIDKCVDFNKYTFAPFTPLGVKVVICIVIYLIILMVSFIFSVSNNIERFTIAQYLIQDRLGEIQYGLTYLNVPEDKKLISLDPTLGVRVDLDESKIKQYVSPYTNDNEGDYA